MPYKMVQCPKLCLRKINYISKARFLKYFQNKGELSWYRLSWLFIECYVYRRIAVAFRRTKTLSQFDPFAAQKQIAFIDRYLTSLEKA